MSELEEKMAIEFANAQYNMVQSFYETQGFLQAPRVLMRPRIFHDGDQWCALYGVNLQEGVAGFGDTPEKAAMDFDRAWYHQTVKGGAP